MLDFLTGFAIGYYAPTWLWLAVVIIWLLWPTADPSRDPVMRRLRQHQREVRAVRQYRQRHGLDQDVLPERLTSPFFRQE